MQKAAQEQLGYMQLHDGVGAVPGDATLVVTVTRHPDVTLLSELGPPAGQEEHRKHTGMQILLWTDVSERLQATDWSEKSLIDARSITHSIRNTYKS